MPSNVAALRLPWYRTLGREQWRVLVASDLGWAFDGFEIYALFLTVGFALDQLLVPTQYQAIPRYVGYVLATTVFGWATGGVLGGIIADYIGRKRTMMLAILAYSLTTALSAPPGTGIIRDPAVFVGVGIGSEWVTGASSSGIWPTTPAEAAACAIGCRHRQLPRLEVWLLIGGLGPMPGAGCI